MKKLEKLDLAKFMTLENKAMTKLIGGAEKPTELKAQATSYKNSSGCTQADVIKNDKRSDVGDPICPTPTDTIPPATILILETEDASYDIDANFQGSFEYVS